MHPLHDFYPLRKLLPGLLLMLCALTAGATETADTWLPIKAVTIQGGALPTEAESLAVRHFAGELNRMSGITPAIIWGDEADGEGTVIRVGTAATADLAGIDPPASGFATTDTACQSYVLKSDSAAGRTVISAVGFGADRSARSSLGPGYALGDLLRRLDVKDGEWGFHLPARPLIQSPAVPARTLYIMNSNNSFDGLSLEFFSDRQIQDYVDYLIDARFSRVAFWHWGSLYLYPGNAEDRRARNERIHRQVRRLFEVARRRGLEVYHLLTPAHVPLELFPDDPRFVSTGYYGRSGVCWSQPETLETARRVHRLEMEYFGPVDGYGVWFYDPAGCFCDKCRPNQAANLFDQLMLVRRLAADISPGARFEAVLWPTWVFPETPTIATSKEETEGFVRAFLDKSLREFGTRGLTILDSCEADYTSIYNGLADPGLFQRDGFMYSTLGNAGEHNYPFTPGYFNYHGAQMRKLQRAGMEGAMLFLQFSATNPDSTFSFVDPLYDAAATSETSLRRYASTFAKGDAFEPFVAYLNAIEKLNAATDYDAMQTACDEARAAWAKVATSPHFYGNREILQGQALALVPYLNMARANDEAAFNAAYDVLKKEVGAIPVWRAFYADPQAPKDVERLHVKPYWKRGESQKKDVGVFN